MLKYLLLANHLTQGKLRQSISAQSKEKKNTKTINSRATQATSIILLINSLIYKVTSNSDNSPAAQNIIMLLLCLLFPGCDCAISPYSYAFLFVILEQHVICLPCYIWWQSIVFNPSASQNSLYINLIDLCASPGPICSILHLP